MTSLTRIPADKLPECLRRDYLASPYFPGLSRGMLAAAVTLCAVFALTSFHRLPADLWGHLNFGRWIVQHQALPTMDPFAAQPSDAPVLHAAWLLQVSGYAVQSTFGNEGLVFGHALLVTLTAGVLMLTALRRGIDPRFAALAAATFFLLDLPIMGTIRPQLFGQLGAALVLLACSELPARRHPLFWLPLVGMLWGNLHGSIWIGLVILGCYTLGVTWRVCCEEQWNFPAALRDRRTIVMASAVGLLLAGACLNPDGPLLLSWILFFGEQAAVSSISEWQALAPGSLTGVLLIGSLVVAACLWKYGARRWELHELLLLAIFALAALSAMSMLAWWAVVWPWVVLPHASAAWNKYLAGRDSPQLPDEPAPMRTLIALGCIFATAIIAPPSYSLLAGKSRGDVAITSRDTPIHLADQVCRLKLAGNVAAPMEWTDYLVYQSEGRLKPLIDGHMRPSRPEAFENYRRLFRGDDEWLKLLHRHQAEYLLLSKKRHKRLLAKVIAESRSGQSPVRILYQDQRGMIVDLMPQGH